MKRKRFGRMGKLDWNQEYARKLARAGKKRERPPKDKLQRRAWKMSRCPTEAESILARKLIALGYQVVIQKIIGIRIVDVYLPTLNIAVEADGKHHFTEDGLKYDADREVQIKRDCPGVKILRYSNYEILGDVNFTHRLNRDLAQASFSAS